jgi:hypothetical protein
MGELYVRQMRGERPSDTELDAIMEELSVCKFTDSLKPMIRSVGGRNPLIPLLPPARDKETGHRQYFCSELAAHVFKRLGVMRPDLDERTYHPSSFVADEDMEIADGHEGFWHFVRPLYASQ